MGEDHFRQLPVVKDDTDTLAAAKLGISRGYKEFLIYGAMGGRLDHTMANIQTMIWILRNGGRASMLDGDTRVTVIGPGVFEIPEDFEGTVSLFSLDRCLSNVTIRGMKYEVKNAAVPNDYPVGCSNETLPNGGSKGAYYSIGEGTGLLVMTENLLNPHR
jgi:thiamine pyrophosphokinase